MAGAYSTLTGIFPYAMRAPLDMARDIVKMLMEPSDQHPDGSSFAVTSDAPAGRRTIWLSEASYQTLRAADILPGLYPSVHKEGYTP